MIFKNLGLGLVLRTLLLFGTLYAAVYFLHRAFYPQFFTISAIMLGQLYELVRYLNRGNLELARFLEAVKNRDFTLQFTEKNTRSDLPQLHYAFNQLNQTFKQLQIEKETQFQLLQSILQIIDTGMLAYDENGEVHWVNARDPVLQEAAIAEPAAFEARQIDMRQDEP